MSKHRLCLQCDDGTALTHCARDMDFTYKGRTLSVKAVRGWHCPVCADCVFDVREGQRYSAEIDAFAAQMDAIEAAEVRLARKRLGLSQAEAGRLFGGGVNAFSEYERGKTQAHRSTVLLLKLLSRHPDLLAELQA